MSQFTLVDRCFHLAYVVAYRLMRVYWMALKVTTHGALVALWHDGRILLIRNSYLDYYSLPGGYVHSRESGRQAAVRELKEEVGLVVDADRLEKVLDLQHVWEAKRERLELFALDCEIAPSVEVDRREVISAEYFSPEQALELKLFPPIRKHIIARTGVA